MPLNANALTTLAIAKDHLGIPVGNTTFDGRLTRFINAASQDIEEITQRKLVRVNGLVEVHHGRRSNLILLREYPAQVITDVRIDADANFGTDKIIPASEYRLTDDRQSLVRLSSYWPAGYHNVQVTYSAGFDPAIDVGPLADLELGCLWLVEWYERHRTREDMGRTSKSKGDESVGILEKMPAMIRDKIEKYSRCEVAFPETGVRNI